MEPSREIRSLLSFSFSPLLSFIFILVWMFFAWLLPWGETADLRGPAKVAIGSSWGLSEGQNCPQNQSDAGVPLTVQGTFYLKHLLLLEHLCLAFNLQRRREAGGKYSAQFLAGQHQKQSQMINHEGWSATERSSKKNHHQEQIAECLMGVAL